MLDRESLAGMPVDLIRALDELIEANGLDRDKLAESDTYCNSIVHLEMFLHQYPQMVGIQLFPRLKTLSLLNQVCFLHYFLISSSCWGAHACMVMYGAHMLAW